MFWSGFPFFGGQPSPLSKWLETWAGHSIENHALVGASLEDGWVKSIRSQYHDLNKHVPSNITTLIMDGGGNDVISHRKDCEAWNDVCRDMIQHSVGIASSILENAHRDGVEHVLYLGFYYLQGLQQAADLAGPMMASLCETAPLDCHFIDPRYNATTGTGLQTPQMLGSDGIHPNEQGYKILAEMIWDVKTEMNIPLR
jgi:lysophospholipase L1-like esterase